MILVDSIFVDDVVTAAEFCCDLKACAGACCCLEGGRGAPLEDAEVRQIESSYPAIKEYLPARSIEVIEKSGLVEGGPGNFTTACVEYRECVFVYFDQGIAKCGFERGFQEGRISWRKPVSCHLFPLRVRQFGQKFIRYEQLPECQAGRENGSAQHIPLVDFLKPALVRTFGDQWYAQLKKKGNGSTDTL